MMLQTRRQVKAVLTLLLAFALTAIIDCSKAQTQRAAGHKQSTAGKATNASWNFDDVPIGKLPAGWKVAETGGEGNPATWQVVTDELAPSPTHTVAITANKNYGRTFNLLMAKDAEYKDLEIKVMVKAVAGREDQGGGPIWRAKDADNYYICRWNPLEDNFRVYYVKNGRRKQLGTANVKTDPTAWHKIEIEHKGTKIEAEFDGKTLIELEDLTFTEPGMVGLWVKADGRTEFDNLRVIDLVKERKMENEDEHAEDENDGDD